MKTFLKGQVHHKDLIEFSFTRKEIKQLEWEDENEFRYNGEMYDVVEKNFKGNRIVVRCIADKKETALLYEYQKNTKHNASNSIIFHLITAQFVLPNDFLIKQPERIIKKIFIDPLSLLSNLASAVVSPPPEVC